MKFLHQLTYKLTALACLLTFTFPPAFASEISDTWENLILDAMLNQTNITAPTNIYVSLYTSTNNDANGGTEVSGGSYARQACTSAFPAASGTGGSIASNAAVTFTTATGSWGTVTDFGIMTASSGGSLIVYSPLDASKAVGSGDTAEFASGNITVTIAHMYQQLEMISKLPVSGEQKVTMAKQVFRDTEVALNAPENTVALNVK